MSANPRVSVIIPAYNRANTVNRAIRSVLSQTFQDFEIIVVDDGSTDGTAAVVSNSFDDPRIECVRHELNRGAAAARNTGIQAARGEYVAWLDSDDEWLPDKLSEQIRLLEESPDVGGTCTGYYMIDDTAQGKEVWIPRVPARPRSWLRELLLRSAWGPGSTLVVRRSAFDDVGPLDESLSWYEDWDWLIRFAASGCLEGIERPLARIHYNMSRGSSTAVEAMAPRFVEKHRASMDTFGPYWRRTAIAQRWFDVSWCLFKDGRYRSGSAYLVRAIAQNPQVLIMNAGRSVAMPLVFVDAVAGTSLISWGSRRKRHLLRR